MYKGQSLSGIQKQFNQLTENDQVKLYMMLTGYQAYWFHDDRDRYQPCQIEDKFDIPLRNPYTGEVISGARVRGAMDMIALDMKENKYYVFENKTTSETIKIGDNYWKTLGISPQAALYYVAAKSHGWPVEGVIYNVARVPTKRRAKGQSDSDFKKAIAEQMIKNPEHFFGRQLFRFSDEQIKRFNEDLYHTWMLMEDVRKRGYAPRYTSNCRAGYFVCEYLDLCSGESTPDDDARWVRNEYHRLGSQPTPDVLGDLTTSSS